MSRIAYSPVWRNLAAAFAIALASGVAAQSAGEGIRVRLADYRFTPDTIEVVAGQPVTLTLANEDGITPHNFTLNDAAAGLAVSANIPAGETRSVTFTPTAAGSYAFHCDKKLPFMKSHRERGMEGRLVVKPAP
jgi:plastocyanin